MITLRPPRRFQVIGFRTVTPNSVRRYCAVQSLGHLRVGAEARIGVACTHPSACREATLVPVVLDA
jgi:hypothetical protein